MKRSQTYVVRLTDETQEVRVILEADPTTKDTLEDRKAKFDLLQQIIDNPALSQCQGQDFQRMLVYNDGTKWIADCSAVVRGKSS